MPGDGRVFSVAVANADAISVSFAGLGLSIASDAVWDGGATAIAEAIGISADRAEQDSTLEATIDVVDGNVRVGVLTTESEVVGNDTVTNYGDIDATAVAVAPSIGIANAVVGGAAAVTTATAESRAVAIDAGGGGDTVTNTAALHARSFANADAVSLTNLVVGVSGAGTSAWEGGPKAEAEAIGISGDGQGNIMTDRYIEYSGNNLDIVQETTTENVGGDDFIDNSGAIVADADAVSVSAAVSIVGVGMAAAVSTSEANARAAAIDAGGGDDTVINEASLTAEAGATAVGVAVDVAAAGLAVAADAVWDGGTTAEAEAIGISGDSNSENTVSVQGIVITDSSAALVAQIRSRTTTPFPLLRIRAARPSVSPRQHSASPLQS